MDRVSLAIFHQQRAEDLYGYARWVMGKALRGGYLAALRRNQFNIEADLAAKHSATARLLMGVE